MSLTPAVLRRLMRELAELQTNPPEGIRVVTNEDNMLDVTGIIQGPEGTPYAGGYFRVKFNFTSEFPASPPKCWMATKIFHPNVSSSGEICVNTLKKDWKSSYGIGHILVTVKCLLIYPNPESALDEEAGKLLLDDYNDYCDRARLITSVHATPKTPPPEFIPPPSGTSTSEASSSNIASSKTTIPSALSSVPLFVPPSTSMKSLPSMSSVLSQPLQSSPSNTISVSNSASSINDKGSNTERLTSPSPLGPSDSNVAITGTTSSSKPVKRGAAPGGGTEKRKKALKRL